MGLEVVWPSLTWMPGTFFPSNVSLHEWGYFTYSLLLLLNKVSPAEPTFLAFSIRDPCSPLWVNAYL